ncbi:TetR/AcrR family transcriptional regulator [Paenibacillus sp. PR3]|uniref:TetR/AcrR family transcriptional regulator n=1 Tax=Paenibacillus terricola TaxID=2763503 RepID=A0ABR8MYT7_9BACL|nr:TetR/AcrR family transcriptional regulator [Paenibacillus terricola]MBD3920476.1 TetR/AcrR family transcriptional regulator [Paenibacillus terricola]
MNQESDKDKVTKQRIVDCARALFSQKGYAATSIQDICKAAGCSKGGVYHHFANKEGLFVYIADTAFAGSWGEWSKRSAAIDDMEELFYVFADYFVDTLQRPLSKAAEEFMRVAAGSESAVRFIGIMNEYMRNFEDFIGRVIASGFLKEEDPKTLAFIVLSFYSGLSDSHAFLSKDEMKVLFRKSTELLLSGIRRS